ncbi:hypothetical protein BB560_006833 [Smittium megazygosporum]|uniref:Glutathione transferase n=1 Tax=Smittium megazygosporum TaxID=133381 RepID=A0A2T9Y066_9FUNG|nr:hypothetical protein BB560_006935 [Smittium megazygosporum]PVU86020.1 hypothetical protein BB560_006833 [Smittium megazygosporum]
MFQIGPTYAWSLLVAVAMNIQCTMAGVGSFSARTKYNIEAPDMGTGRQSAKLSDKAWEDLNRAIRIHMNYVEQLPTSISSVLICGLFYPTLAAYLGGAYVLGRHIYGSGYSKDAARRTFGFYIFFLPLIGLIGGSVVGIEKVLWSYYF